MAVSIKALLERARGSEYEANQALATNAESGQHHVYVKTRGKMKAIAGPFPSKEAAEKSDARKFGDGVAPSHMVEDKEQEQMDKYLTEIKESKEMIKTDHGFLKEAFITEIMAYIKHGDDTIAYNGAYHVGTKKRSDGKYDPTHTASFDKEEDAKAFIDGGKKDWSKSKTKPITEAKAGDNYHSVFVPHKDGGWIHHGDFDNKEDADEEMYSLRNGGEKPKRLVVPKDQANWHKMGGEGITNYVEGRLKKSIKESFIDAVLSKNFAQAQEYFESMMNDKVQVTLNARKVELAQSMYSPAASE